MKPDQSPFSFYGVAAGVVGQVGCFLILVVGAALLFGMFLDQQFGTKPRFLLFMLLASIPLNLWLVYRYTLYKSRQFQASSPAKKEDTTRDV